MQRLSGGTTAELRANAPTRAKNLPNYDESCNDSRMALPAEPTTGRLTDEGIERFR